MKRWLVPATIVLFGAGVCVGILVSGNRLNRQTNMEGKTQTQVSDIALTNTPPSTTRPDSSTNYTLDEIGIEDFIYKQDSLSLFERDGRYYQLIAHADLSQLYQLLEGLQSVPLNEREPLLRVLYLRLVEIDPGFTLNHAVSRNGLVVDNDGIFISQSHLGFISQLVAKWATQDLEQAINFAQGLKNTTLNRVAARAIIETNSALPRQQLLDLADRLQADYYADTLIANERLQEFADDPQYYWNEYLNANLLDDNSSLSNRLIAQWVNMDPLAALIAITNMPPSQQRQNFQRQALIDWAQKDSQAAMEWLGARNENLSPETLTQLFTALSKQSPQQSFEWLSLFDQDKHQFITDGIVAGWASQDVNAAAAWLAESSTTQMSTNSIFLVYEGLLKQSPNDAIDWLLALPEENSKRAVSFAFIRVKDQQLEFIGNKIASLGNSPQKNVLAREYVSKLAGTSPNEALNWINAQNLQNDKLIQNALIGVWSSIDLNAAIDHTEKLPTQDLKDNAYYTIAISRGARANISKITALIDNIQDDKLRSQAKRSLTFYR